MNVTFVSLQMALYENVKHFGDSETDWVVVTINKNDFPVCHYLIFAVESR